MTKQGKAIIGIMSLFCLVCACVACIWLWPYIAYMLLVSSVTPAQGHMHCWVKVVNQNGRGVEGYKIRIVQEHSSLWPFSKSGDIITIVTTGGDGTIEYTSKGTTGRVFFGSPSDLEWKLNPRHLQAGDIYVYTHLFNQAKEKEPLNYLGSKNNPYLLHVFSVGQPQELLYWDKKLQVEREHDWVCIDVLAGIIWESNKPEGDIAVRYNELTKENINAHCTRSFVAGQDCVIEAVNDDWGLRGPEEGYKKKLCSDRDWSGGNMYGVAIYYRLNRKRYLYGRLDLGGSVQFSGSFIKSYTNLKGERNLYFEGYEASINDPWSRHIENYISPPVDPADLSSGVQRERKIIE